MNDNSSLQVRSIPIYNTRGEAEAFLFYPYLFNRIGEWIGWVTNDREVYSVLGVYVGKLTNEPRIISKRVTATIKPRKTPPQKPPHITIPATVPLAPLMRELRYNELDVLLDEPGLLHTLDAGDLREDLD